MASEQAEKDYRTYARIILERNEARSERAEYKAALRELFNAMEIYHKAIGNRIESPSNSCAYKKAGYVWAEAMANTKALLKPQEADDGK